MKFKVEECYGSVSVKFEDGTAGKVSGQMVEWKGVVGRIWSISDTSSSCGGHGVGNITSSQVVIATKDMQIIPVKLKWDSDYELEMLGSYAEEVYN